MQPGQDMQSSGAVMHDAESSPPRARKKAHFEAGQRRGRACLVDETIDLGEEIKEEFDNSVQLIGQRRGLPGEHIIFEIEETCQLTNYRIVQRQSKLWCERQQRLAVDAWLKDITCVSVTKEPYSKVVLALGVILIVGGVVNYDELGIHLSDSLKLGFNMAPIGFYIIGLFILLAGQLVRRTVLVLGVVGQNSSSAFTVPLKAADVWKVNDCVDLIRLLQMPFALRKQRE